MKTNREALMRGFKQAFRDASVIGLFVVAIFAAVKFLIHSLEWPGITL